MEGTRIRWAEHTWNPTTGCDKVSPGCDNCYAETIAIKFGPQGGNGTSFPNGFTPTYKPQKLGEPAKFLRKSGPGRIFVNSMSDLHHADFTDAQRDAIYDVMLTVDAHDYLVLTKRPKQMAAYFCGPDGFLARRGLDSAPAQLWLGTSIENDKYTWRANHLRAIPAVVHFLSVEPMLGPVPSLDLTGIEWVICGGESGNGFRTMDLQWARDLKAAVETAGVAFFFKQQSHRQTEAIKHLDGELIEEYPLPHPADRHTPTGGRPASLAIVGRYVGRHAADHGTPVVVASAQGALL